MKKTILLSLTMMWIYSIYSQPLFYSLKSHISGTYFDAGLSQTMFLNANYSQRLKDNKIQPSLGYELGVGYTIFPFDINLSWQESNFTVDKQLVASYLDIKSNKFQYSSWELGTSLYLAYFSKYILPNVGIAYQYGVLSDNASEYLSSLSQPVLKLGFTSFLFKRIGIKGAYRQSLKLGSNHKAFQQYSVTISYKLKK